MAPLSRLSSIPILLWLITAVVCEGIQRQPWSFKPVADPALPKVLNVRWPSDDLDRFVLARLEEKKLAPQRIADQYTLLRRASFDLTGLPPTPSEIAAFVNDPATTREAFAKVVDRLLKSPRFGERWARHWLDASRYADSVGQTWNAPFLYAHRYRNYVIDAFNQDKPYDRFIREQVAGDLLPARDDDEKRSNLTATGFLTLGSMKLVLPFGEEFRLERADDQIDVTTRAMLGLTFSCARCHDHKYEPISQRDYYALAGVFWSTATWPGQRNRGGGGPKGYVDQTYALSASGSVATQTQTTATRSAPNMMSPAMNAQYVKNGQWTGIHVNDPNRIMGVSESTIADCAVRIKGEPYQRGPLVKRGSFSISGLPELGRIPANASGRRQLADWIASTNNPLTARVMVNRVWQHLFGRGIVPTVDNLGSSGERPSYPELLDHLATRFMRDGWSLKKLIRAILLSRTYQMSSATYANNTLIDEANTHLWRASARRLEMESIRDTLLFVEGTLRPGAPPGIPVAGNGGKGRYGRTRSLLDINSHWRTIYLPVLRDLLPKMYGVFDFPNPSQIKGQREVTTVPPQSLYLLNNELPIRAARGLTNRVLANVRLRNNTARIQYAWLLALSRPPTANELRASTEFLGQLAGDENYRWQTLLQGLLATTEFRYVK